MRRKLSSGCLSSTLLALSAAASPAPAAGLTESIEEALSFNRHGKNGAVKLDLNYRYENINQDKGPGNPKTANANTVRLRLGLLSPVFHGLQGYAEYEGNYVLQSDYNNGLGNKPEFSTVADPDANELNQLWISYAGIPGTLIKGGRQRIKLDDDRFIGNVGWRQLETTYDSVLITHNSQALPGLTVNAGYIGNVNTATSTTENINAPILNINYKVGNYGNLIGYGYWLGYTEQENYAKSNQTYGLRFDGKSKINDQLTALYTAEWSLQRDYRHSPADYQADRINLMGGLNAFNLITVRGAMEQLNGYGANKRFITPLGTNHVFQGWADQFFVTPNDGVRDVFATLSTVLDHGSLTLTGVFHDFHDDTGQVHYGKEWDFMAVKTLGKHYALMAKYAYYDADQFATDTQKIWMQVNVNF